MNLAGWCHTTYFLNELLVSEPLVSTGLWPSIWADGAKCLIKPISDWCSLLINSEKFHDFAR